MCEVRSFCCSAGVQCEVNEDDCTPSPGSSEPRCRNGGQCVDGVGRYTCSCPPGFVGEHCEGDVNECQSGPCSAAGSLDCIELVNDYQCLCRLGYTGTCILPAQTGGTQVERFSVVGVRASRKSLLTFLPFVADYFLTFSWVCFFLLVPLGRHCESMVDLCVSQPCRNGGVCTMNMSSVHGYTCTCRPVSHS